MKNSFFLTLEIVKNISLAFFKNFFAKVLERVANALQKFCNALRMRCKSFGTDCKRVANALTRCKSVASSVQFATCCERV